ncbi:MAG TPA: hypothetical protein DC049_14970 [Spirochaetia bacterium]|nr:hypothetical protein [Spirochaetia bacterium]
MKINSLKTAKEYKFNLSPITSLYALYIIISAAFMRNVLNIIKTVFPGQKFEMFMLILFIMFLLAALFIYLYRGKISLSRIIRLLLFFTAGGISGYLIFSRIKIPEERFHILQFGLLAALVLNENSNKKGFICAFFIIILTAALDEIFQFFLPARWGTIEDIILGTTGGIWGMLLWAILFFNNCKK